MLLPKIAVLPEFNKHKLTWIVIVLVKVILEAAWLCPSDWDQLFYFGFDEISLAGVGFDVGYDG